MFQKFLGSVQQTTVAVANKNARIIWSMLRNETEYQVV
uniref:Uncharacterized protein n=1 Tax=Escherichia coli ACN001 TaxID=1311757 RepID=A0A140WYC1_ECOLX|nr:hypothetical protein J444_pB54 [Escherichia coli ACN001]